MTYRSDMSTKGLWEVLPKNVNHKSWVSGKEEGRDRTVIEEFLRPSQQVIFQGVRFHQLEKEYYSKWKSKRG